jgi:hypothetical protein
MSPDDLTSKSTGVLTDTESCAAYQFNNRKLLIHWDNPFADSDSADARVEPTLAPPSAPNPYNL